MVAKAPTDQRPPTEEVVRNYYTNINQGDFKASWNMLSDNFRTNRKAHPKGYDSYVDWWGRQIQRVEINQIKPLQATGETATVDAQLTYSLNGGKSSPADVRFYLVWDDTSGKWVVKDAQRVRRGS
ncbi:MAG: nuclear transport factor 2 family protein [Calothrix sp. SM1_7_51]|nr:nuclear transport factor 2 family protein [Calothrix sp. SM1_7_51]